jgi:hypothetical protein
MDHVIGAAFGHVAIEAIPRTGMLSRGDELREIVAVAARACALVALHGFFAARNVMRIMAARARKRQARRQVLCLLEAGRLSQPVGGVGDFEVVFGPFPVGVREVQDVL